MSGKPLGLSDIRWGEIPERFSEWVLLTMYGYSQESASGNVLTEVLGWENHSQ